MARLYNTMTIPAEMAVAVEIFRARCEGRTFQGYVETIPTYGEVFDWLVNRGYYILLDSPNLGREDERWYAFVRERGEEGACSAPGNCGSVQTWEEAAQDGIRLCMDLIEDKKIRN